MGESFEPQKYFVGLIDFFSIILPGASLAYVININGFPLDNAESITVFLFASYLLGHLIFLTGSWMDILYDWIKGYTINTQVTKLAYRKKLHPWFMRILIWLVFKQERDIAVERAKKIKNEILAPLQAEKSMNTFQWCKAMLMKKSPESLAAVQRFEADSKFFRSFTIVLVLIFFFWPFIGLQYYWPFEYIVVVFVLFLFALWRYMEQRHKATNQAYWSVINLIADENKITLEKKEKNEITDAVGIVSRGRLEKKKYLLVTVKNDPQEWTFPEGQVEGEENSMETAIRAVHEETGVWAVIQNKLSDKDVPENLHIHFFIMKAIGYGFREEKKRKHKWLSLNEEEYQKFLDKVKKELKQKKINRKDSKKEKKRA